MPKKIKVNTVPKKNVLRVASIDFDGCLSHHSYQTAIRNDPKKPVTELCIKNNPILMDALRQMQIKKIMVGSNRQDIQGDGAESQVSNWVTKKTDKFGSCYAILNAMSEALHATFDSFLLADLYSGRKYGYTYEQAQGLQAGHNFNYADNFQAQSVNNISQWKFDKYKISIIYAQIQKLSYENPDKEIEYNFIDDREDILEMVEEFFKNKANKALIPGNVTIKTYRYYDNNTEKYAESSSMVLEKRKTRHSLSPSVRANPLFDFTIRSWYNNNHDDLAQLRQTKEGYELLTKEHKSSIQLNIKEITDEIVSIVKRTKTSGKAAISFCNTKFNDYDSLKKAIVEVYKECWDKEYNKGRATIGYSAILRGITKELEKDNLNLLKEVKGELLDYFKLEANTQNAHSSKHETYRAGSTVFIPAAFEQDWNKFTGANVSIFQRAAKTFMQQFKKSNEAVIPVENNDSESSPDSISLMS